jgi:hypothetical protein
LLFITLAKKLTPSLRIVRREAWRLTVLLVMRADLSEGSSLSIRLNGGFLYSAANEAAFNIDKLLRFVVAGMTGFYIHTTESEGSWEATQPLFLELGFADAAADLIAKFNPAAVNGLRRLQHHVRELQDGNLLSMDLLDLQLSMLEPSRKYYLRISHL